MTNTWQDTQPLTPLKTVFPGHFANGSVETYDFTGPRADQIPQRIISEEILMKSHQTRADHHADEVKGQTRVAAYFGAGTLLAAGGTVYLWNKSKENVTARLADPKTALQANKDCVSDTGVKEHVMKAAYPQLQKGGDAKISQAQFQQAVAVCTKKRTLEIAQSSDFTATGAALALMITAIGTYHVFDSLVDRFKAARDQKKYKDAVDMSAENIAKLQAVRPKMGMQPEVEATL